MPEFWVLQPWMRMAYAGNFCSPERPKGAEGICAEQSDQDEKTEKGKKGIQVLVLLARRGNNKRKETGIWRISLDY